MFRLRLRGRFISGGVLLVVVAISSGIWMLAALSRLAGILGHTVQESDRTTAATAKFSSALEREDDALLLALAGSEDARRALERERRNVDAAIKQLIELATEAEERELVATARRELEAYRKTAASVVESARTGEGLVQYHREANPLLRRVVESAHEIRNRHFESTRRTAKRAGAEVEQSQRVAAAIFAAASLVSVLVVWYLRRFVLDPLRALVQGAEALRAGNFEARVELRQSDEIGELAETFNGMAADLAEFRRTNLAEVLRARSTLETTLEALPDAVILVGSGGRILAANRAAKKLVGREQFDTLHNLELADRSGPEILTLAQSTTAHDLSRAISVESDGIVRRLLPRAHAVPDHATLLVLYDVTELARFDEMRAELVAVASHELRTPLTTMQMSLLMLSEADSSLDARQKELIDTLKGGVLQLQQTIDEFLDLTRIEAGKLRLNREPITVLDFLRQTVGRWERNARVARVELVLRAAEREESRIDADMHRLGTVFDNLLANAFRYTAEGGRVTVAVLTNADGMVEISVTDTGTGVPMPFRTRIFEKFFRVEQYRQSSENAPRGAGLGLYLCREILVAHGGSIVCEASDDDRGTCMIVRLPGAAAVAPGA